MLLYELLQALFAILGVVSVIVIALEWIMQVIFSAKAKDIPEWDENLSRLATQVLAVSGFALFAIHVAYGL